jgi:Uma2 family endonuclease
MQFESVDPAQKQWTREECAVIIGAGLTELGRYELIQGKLIRKMGKNVRHVQALMCLIGWLHSIFHPMRIQQEPPINVAPEDNPTSEPEPDATVLRTSFRKRFEQAAPNEIELVAEVSDSSLVFDLTSKAALYARAQIQEYWVLDVNARRLIVHRDPVDGLYRTVLAYSAEESVTMLAAPASPVLVGDLF